MTACARCGKDPAEGFATINEDRYCHGDTTDDRGDTCYEAEGFDRWAYAGQVAAIFANDDAPDNTDPEEHTP